MSQLQSLVGKTRKLVHRLLAQTKVPPDQYTDDNVIPIVIALKKILELIQQCASDAASQSFIAGATELIPVIVTILRQKSRGLVAKPEEERLRPLILQFQADYLRITQKQETGALTSSGGSGSSNSTHNSPSVPRLSSPKSSPTHVRVSSDSKRRVLGGSSGPIVKGAVTVAGGSRSNISVNTASAPGHRSSSRHNSQNSSASGGSGGRRSPSHFSSQRGGGGGERLKIRREPALNRSSPASPVHSPTTMQPSLSSPSLSSPSVSVRRGSGGTPRRGSSQRGSYRTARERELERELLSQRASSPTQHSATGAKPREFPSAASSGSHSPVVSRPHTPTQSQRSQPRSQSPTPHSTETLTVPSPIPMRRSRQRHEGDPLPRKGSFLYTDETSSLEETVPALTTIPSLISPVSPRVSPSPSPPISSPTSPRDGSWEALGEVPEIGVEDDEAEEPESPLKGSLLDPERNFVEEDWDTYFDLDGWGDWDWCEGDPVSDDEIEGDYVSSIAQFQQETYRGSSLTMADITEDPAAALSSGYKGHHLLLVAEDHLDLGFEEDHTYSEVDDTTFDPLPEAVRDAPTSPASMRNAQIEREIEMARAKLAQTQAQNKRLYQQNLPSHRSPMPSSSAPSSPYSSPTKPSSPSALPHALHQRSTAATRPISKEGWMLKLSPNATLGKRFQKRYFILDKEILSYYRTVPDPSTKPLGQVYLTNELKVYRLSPAESLDKTAHLSSEDAFELRTTSDGLGRTYFLVCADAREKKEWCSAITMVKMNYSGKHHASGVNFSGKRNSHRDSLRSLSKKKLKQAKRKASKRYR